MFNKFSERIVSPSSGSGGGVPDGGTTGQHLSKASNADGDVIWETPPSSGGVGIPPGGTTNQALLKLDGTDYNADWADVVTGSGSGVPPGGTTGQHLAKQSSTDGDVIWETPPTVDLSDYAYLPGRSGGQLLHGGTGVDDALVLQGTTANATGTTDTVKIVSGNDGSIDSIRVRGDGGVLIGEGDRFGFGFGDALAVNGSVSVLCEADQLGAIFKNVNTQVAHFISNNHDVVRISQLDEQTANIGSGALLTIARDNTLNGFTNTTSMLDIYDSPFGPSADKVNIAINGVIDNVTRFRFYPRVIDGGTARAYFFDTKNTLTNTAATLLEILTGGARRFVVYATGKLNIIPPAEYADDTAAAAGGLAIGDVYRTGSILKVRVA